MRERAIGAALAVAACLIAAAGAHAQAPAPLTGPPGSSHAKVLVIGVDGARWDLVRRAMAEGRAPNLARLAREGVAGPTLLPYTPPAALTISEVGWSTIAAGVGPAKHGVNGFMLNNDPRPGHQERLRRLPDPRGVAAALDQHVPGQRLGQHRPAQERRPDLRQRHRRALRAGRRGQRGLLQPRRRRGHRAAARYLRRGDPDAGFVYLGAVDETAHLIGSATPAYRDAIGAADKRIGALTEAIRQRPTYGLERWTVIVTTDHGQQDLNYPSTLSHGGPSELERTSFVFAAGPGIAGGGTAAPGRGGHRAHRPAPAGAGSEPGVEPGRPVAGHRSRAAAAARRRGPACACAAQADAGAGGGRGARGAGRRLRPPGAAAAAWRYGAAPACACAAGSVKVARKALRVTLARGGSRRVLVKTPRGRLAISRGLLRRLRRDPKLTLAATVAETGDQALGRRIAVRVRR